MAPKVHSRPNDRRPVFVNPAREEWSTSKKRMNAVWGEQTFALRNNRGESRKEQPEGRLTRMGPTSAIDSIVTGRSTATLRKNAVSISADPLKDFIR
jgi:hypothetical protein